MFNWVQQQPPAYGTRNPDGGYPPDFRDVTDWVGKQILPLTTQINCPQGASLTPDSFLTPAIPSISYLPCSLMSLSCLELHVFCKMESEKIYG